MYIHIIEHGIFNIEECDLSSSYHRQLLYNRNRFLHCHYQLYQPNLNKILGTISNYRLDIDVSEPTDCCIVRWSVYYSNPNIFNNLSYIIFFSCLRFTNAGFAIRCILLAIYGASECDHNSDCIHTEQVCSDINHHPL